MAEAPSRSRSAGSNWNQVHDDVGGLKVRVGGLESTVTRIENNMTTGFGDISKQLRDQRTPGTSIGSFLGTSAAVGTVFIILIGGFFWAVIGPMQTVEAKIAAGLERSVPLELYEKGLDAQQKRNLAMEAETEKVKDVVSVLSNTLSELKGELSAQHEAYLRDLMRDEARIEIIDSNIIKRPEILALLDNHSNRIDALSARINELVKQLESIFPGADVIKDIQAQLRELRMPAPQAGH